MFKGLQWKIVLLYSLLILFALQLIGVYLVQSLERYYFRNFVEGMETQAKLLSTFLTPRMLEEENVYIKDLVDGFKATRDIDIIVLDRYSRVLGTSGLDEMIGGRLIREEVTMALAGNTGEAIHINPVNEQRYYYLAFPVKYEGTVMGVIYLSSSLKKTDQTLREIKGMIITGSLFVLIISFLIGMFLARTITSPIREVTQKAELMAQGDFSQRIKAYSEDEIGQLVKMYNFMASRLNNTMREISSEKSKVEAILNNMRDGILALDGSGVLIHINPAAIKIIEGIYSIPLEVGKTPLFVLNDIIGKNRLEQFYSKKQSVVFETVNENPLRIFRFNLVPFQIKEGKTDGMMVVAQDITGESEIKKRQQEFVANVSHELKTPLTSIKSYVETLLEENLENKDVALKFLKVVNNETDRMVSLIKDLLLLSRHDAKTESLNRSRVDLEPLIREIIDKEVIREADKPSVRVLFEKGIPAVYADRGQINQVFVNLLSNARQYTPVEGTVTLTAQVKGGWVEICVKDTGIGIPEDEINRVFERFYRVDKTRSRNYGGTGLGLSIARQAVEAHGGEIWIESTLDKGTAVFFTLPIYEEKEIEE